MATITAKEQASKWSQAATPYVKYFEPTSVAAGRFMLNGMKLQFQEQPLRILEAGAGAGGLAKEMLTLNGLSLEHLYVTDMADGMLEKCRERLQDYSSKVTIENKDFTDFGANYGSESMDRYYANMCLHYAEDPVAVLKETSRVLKKGGIAGFTIWGREDCSNVFSIVPDVLDELGLEKKNSSGKRSSFHLGQDDEKLRQMFFQQGFSKCCVVHYPGVIEALDPVSYVELIIDGAPSTKKQVESFAPEMQEKIRQQVFEKAKAILDRGEPLMLDIGVIIAQKLIE